MFYTLEERKETHDQEVIVQNLDASNNHWQSINYIAKIANELELILYGKSDFGAAEKGLIDLFLSLNKTNPRINEFRFYKDKDNKNLFICLCISTITTFKPDNFLRRNISINLKKQGKLILFTDITQEEWNKVGSELELPKTWELDESMTKKFNKYKQLFV